MGGFPLWNTLIILIIIVVPIVFIVNGPPKGPNRFGTAPEPMGFGEALESFVRKCFTFRGRASRSEYWYTALALLLTNAVMLITDRSGLISNIFCLITFVPATALATRRLHDINRSGWHQLLAAFPIGIIAVFIWLCSKGKDITSGGKTPNEQRPTALLNIERW